MRDGHEIDRGRGSGLCVGHEGATEAGELRIGRGDLAGVGAVPGQQGDSRCLERRRSTVEPGQRDDALGDVLEGRGAKETTTGPGSSMTPRSWPEAGPLDVAS